MIIPLRTSVLVLFAAIAGAPLMAQAPQRDSSATLAVGTATIRGRVVTADPSHRPVRRARVTVGNNERAVATDDNGVFVFDKLPAGSYTLSASKAAYLPMQYGAAKPGRAGTSIVLSARQTIDVSIELQLGGVITGTVRDMRGRPVSGIDVGVVALLPPGPAAPSFSGYAVQTDDRGVYRIFGLPPGQYYVATVMPNFFSNGIAGRRSVEENDALFAQLMARSTSPTSTGTAPAKKPEPLPPASSAGFAPVLYPGTTRVDAATVITIAPGESREGIDMAIAPARTGTIEGTVQGPVSNLDRVELSLVIEGPQFPAFSSSRPLLTQQPDKQGRFRYENLPPPRYSILARAVAGDGDPAVAQPFNGTGFASGGGSVGRGGGPPANPEGNDFVHGRTEVEVDGGTNSVSIVLMPGATVSGVVKFDRSTAAVPTDLTTIRLRVTSTQNTSMSVTNNTAMGNQYLSMPFTPVRADGTWQVRGVPPSQFTITGALPTTMTKDWWLRSALLGERDLLDGAFDVQSGQDMTGIVFTFTDRHSELSGSLTVGAGQPATDYFIIAMPADPKLWVRDSRRVKMARPATDGKFSFKDLPGGNYLLVALTDVTTNDTNDPAWLASIAAAGAPVVVTDGGKTVQDLRVGGVLR